MPPSLAAVPARPAGASARFMWLTPDRVLYVGLLGAPAVRTMGSVNVYVASEGAIRMRVGGGAWHSGQLAVVQPYVPHQVASDARIIFVLHVEAETVDLRALPSALGVCGIVHDAAIVARVRQVAHRIGTRGRELGLTALDFDDTLFGAALARRRVDPRIQSVLDMIKRDPSAQLGADACARSVHLSFSRFLHLFKDDVGAPFRSFRTWKRARSLLHHVNRDANLAHVAQDTGYPDSTHFSHSIRHVYGLKPKDIFAGSRRLAIYAPQAAASAGWLAGSRGGPC